jgi:hypothetical protein
MRLGYTVFIYLLRINKTKDTDKVYVSVGVMKDYKLKLGLFIYYESTKRKVKTKYLCGCRSYEILHWFFLLR